MDRGLLLMVARRNEFDELGGGRKGGSEKLWQVGNQKNIDFFK